MDLGRRGAEGGGRVDTYGVWAGGVVRCLEEFQKGVGMDMENGGLVGW